MLSSNILTNTVRVIGCICMVGSVMVMTQLISNLLHHQDGSVKKEIDVVGIWTLHCAQFLKGENHMVLMAGYTFVYSLSSCLLIIASYMKYRLLVFPWLVCEGLCIVSDGLAVIAIFSGKNLKNVDAWQMGAMMFGLCFTLITWGIVFEALRVWGLEKQQREAAAAPPPYSERSLEQPPNAGTPRSASRFYQPPRPPARREFACRTYAL